MAKKVNTGVFDILKSLADDKAAKLEAIVRSGREAEASIPTLEQDIQNLQEYIENNRYDRASVREAKADIADTQSKIHDALEQKKDGEKAAADLAQHYQKFKKTYVGAVRGDKIAQIQAAIDALRNEIAKIDGNMDTEMINMENETLDDEVRNQAREDFELYQQQQESLLKMIEQYKAELNDAQKY